ncbi:hypothetical protein, partial [Belliella kenyensis]
SNTFTGLAPGTYSLRVRSTTDNTCSTAGSSTVTIEEVPDAPSVPAVASTIQPTCEVATGSVELSGLPTGDWTITSSPAGFGATGNTATTTISGLTPGTTYTFTVTSDATGCSSPASTDVVINDIPERPILTVGTVTCSDTGYSFTVTTNATNVTVSAGTYAGGVVTAPL